MRRSNQKNGNESEKMSAFKLPFEYEDEEFSANFSESVEAEIVTDRNDEWASHSYQMLPKADFNYLSAFPQDQIDHDNTCVSPKFLETKSQHFNIRDDSSSVWSSIQTSNLNPSVSINYQQPRPQHGIELTRDLSLAVGQNRKLETKSQYLLDWGDVARQACDEIESPLNCHTLSTLDEAQSLLSSFFEDETTGKPVQDSRVSEKVSASNEQLFSSHYNATTIPINQRYYENHQPKITNQMYDSLEKSEAPSLWKAQHFKNFYGFESFEDNANLQVRNDSQQVPYTKQRGKEPTGRGNKKSQKQISPKRPLSAYNIFFKEERQRILEETPSPSPSVIKTDSGNIRRRQRRDRNVPHHKIDFATLGKMISKRWKSLSQEDLAPYQVKAREDRERYEREKQDLCSKVKASTETEPCIWQSYDSAEKTAK